jgi:hypothetical protein
VGDNCTWGEIHMDEAWLLNSTKICNGAWVSIEEAKEKL